MRPSWKPCAARATACWPTSRTSSARRWRRSWPPSSCCATGCDSMPPQAREKLVVSLERGTLRLTRLIDNLLESVRIESGQLSIRHQSVSLREVIEDAHALLESLLVQRRAAAGGAAARGPAADKRRQDASDAGVRQPHRQCQQVLPGRLGAAHRRAARRATRWKPGWKTKARACADGDVSSVFERFRRGTDAEPEPGGLGLGLWIVKSVIERHGGAIAVQRTPEQRTRFSFTLPVQSGVP